MAAIDREEFREWMEVLRNDIGGVNERLDTLNGRTRVVETEVAVLKDRATPRDTAARMAGGGALLTALIALLKQWLSTP